MIRMKQPSLCLQSHDVPPPSYRMWRTLDLREGIHPMEIVFLIMQANTEALSAWGAPLRNIIFNAHGYSGRVAMGGVGQPGIDKDSAALFGLLRPLNLGTIWLLSCKAAEDSGGKNMCSTLARMAGTTVIASTAAQEASNWEGLRITCWTPGYIDDLEGDVHGFTGRGSIHPHIDPTEFVDTVRV